MTGIMFVNVVNLIRQKNRFYLSENSSTQSETYVRINDNFRKPTGESSRNNRLLAHLHQVSMVVIMVL